MSNPQTPFEVPNVIESLRRDYEAGKITVEEAAREFNRCNYTTFVDYAYTREKLGAFPNPFLERARETRSKADQLSPFNSADSVAMRSAFPLGTGSPGNASSRRTRRKHFKNIDKSIDKSLEATKLYNKAKSLEAKAYAFEAGMIDEFGNPTEKAVKVQTQKAEAKQKARSQVNDFIKAKISKGCIIHPAGSNNSLIVKRVNKKTVTTESGTKWGYDEIQLSHDGKPMSIKEFKQQFSDWSANQ